MHHRAGLGSLELEGDLTHFEPLLSAAEVLHAGKGTTFGLGRLAWKPIAEPGR